MSMFHVKHINLTKALYFAFLFCIPLQLRIIFQTPQTYIGGVFSYTEAIMLYGTDLIFIALITSWFLAKTDSIKQSKSTIWAFLGLFTWLALSMFHVKPDILAFYKLLKWSELILIAWVSPTILRNRSDLSLATIFLYISAVLQAILGIIQFHVQHMVGLKWLGEYIAPIGTSGLATIDIHSEKLIRAYGTFPHPNILAAFLFFGLCLGFYLVSRETQFRIKQSMFIVSCGTIIILIGIFLTFSRLAWAISGLVTMFYIFQLYYKKAYIKAFYLIVIGIVSCGTILLAYPRLLLSYGEQLTTTSNSIVLRESFNRMGLDLLKTAPLTGVGLGNYISTMQQKFQLADWEYQPAHNAFIFLAVETGGVGLIIFLYFLWQIVRSTWNNKNNGLPNTLLIIFVSFLILSMFDHYFVTIQQGQLMFFALLGLMLAIKNINDTNVPQT